ncbi:hypothetical protein CHU98_g8044 [Xylaria longipes]|nr:hypothetical protein CHU98_g8044 [Xylaria longipes]
MAAAGEEGGRTYLTENNTAPGLGASEWDDQDGRGWVTRKATMEVVQQGSVTMATTDTSLGTSPGLVPTVLVSETYSR